MRCSDVASISSRVNREKQAIEERVDEAKTSLSNRQAELLSFNQKRILISIARFMPDKKMTSDQNRDRMMLIGEMKRRAQEIKKGMQDKLNMKC